MKPILLIHGYGSEGKSTSAAKIYGKLPTLLRQEFGSNIHELNLSRWVSLSDGVALDDVSFAMDRALKQRFSHLLVSGFHVIIHSTGALVVRNWIQQHSPRPCPIGNVIHLAGANFGSGLAHIGKGQLARWGRFIFAGTDSGSRVLNELEFGNWKTLDLHRHFLEPGNTMYDDYQVQEFCLIGSQSFAGLLKTVFNLIPIRYVKEDCSDNTVRGAACNLNACYISVFPSDYCQRVSTGKLSRLMKKREDNNHVADRYYAVSFHQAQPPVPFGLLYETSHFGDDIGIVDGKKNRRQIISQIKAALKTPYDRDHYQKINKRFQQLTDKTLLRVSKLKPNFLTGWNKQKQYEGHIQIIIRVKDQFGDSVDNTDITFKSQTSNEKHYQLENMIEDKHRNAQHPGTFTFYLRSIHFDKDKKQWRDKLDHLAPLMVEITGYEPDSELIAYVPLTMTLSSQELRTMLHSFNTTVIDVTLMRLPQDRVFHIEKA